MTRSDSGAVPGRPHHISSIAHLFLQDEPPETGLDSGLDSCTCAIASPQGSPVSAFAAAALAHGLPGPATLFEERRLRWSVSSFPGPERLVVTPGRDSSGPPDGYAGDGAPRDIRWHHLGCLDSDRLAHLESLFVSRGFGYDPLTEIAELFWCVLAGEVGRFESAYTLGRAVELLRPGSLQILIFPDAWSRAGLPGWLDEIAAYRFEPVDADSLLRFREKSEWVCAGVPVSFHSVEGSDNLTGSFGPQEDGKSLWGQLARRAAGLL